MALACTISRHGLHATIDGSRLDNGSYNPKQCGGLSAVLCCAQECYGAAETAENGALCRCLVHGSERWRSVDRRTV